MAPEPPPSSTGGSTRTPPVPSSADASGVYYATQCVVLSDWWLERVQGAEGKIRVAGTAPTEQMRKGALACRVFRSTAIKSCQGLHKIKTEDGCIIHIHGLLNIPETRRNGFSEKVCKDFEFGFPSQWVKLVNPNMEQQNEQPLSESAVEYWVEKFSSGDLTDLKKYAFEANDSYPSEWYTSNTPVIQSLSNLSVEKEGGYRRRVGSGQAEEDADIQHENVQSCSSEHEIVTVPIDSAIVNENANITSSDLETTGTPKCGKAPLNMRSTDALELPTERTPQFGAVRGSEDSPVRRLRSGKVFGTPSGLMKSGHKKRRIQCEASSQNMIPNEGNKSTAGLTSHENDLSVAGVVTKDKQESHDSHRGISATKAKKKRKESKKLFWNWC